MNALTGLSAQDIATIAASGVMGLAAVFIVITLLRPNPPAPMTLWAAIVVILLATVVQIGTKWLDLGYTAHNQVAVILTPADLSAFEGILPELDSGGAPQPRLWLSNGNARCNPNSNSFDAKAPDCLTFSQQFRLDANQETINISMLQAMQLLQQRVLKLTAVTRAAAIQQLSARTDSAKGSSPIGEDTSAP